jgi:hypothetical protein
MYRVNHSWVIYGVCMREGDGGKEGVTFLLIPIVYIIPSLFSLPRTQLYPLNHTHTPLIETEGTTWINNR